MIDEELSEFQNGFQYDEELFNKIKKDGIQEFSLLELELIDLVYRVTNSLLYIENKTERYNYLNKHLLDVEGVVDNKLPYLSDRELKYAKAVSTIIRYHLRLRGKNFDLTYGIPNDIEGFGELFTGEYTDK